MHLDIKKIYQSWQASLRACHLFQGLPRSEPNQEHLRAMWSVLKTLKDVTTVLRQPIYIIIYIDKVIQFTGGYHCKTWVTCFNRQSLEVSNSMGHGIKVSDAVLTGHVCFDVARVTFTNVPTKVLMSLLSCLLGIPLRVTAWKLRTWTLNFKVV